MARHVGLKTGQHRAEFFEISGTIARPRNQMGPIRVPWTFLIARHPPRVGSLLTGYYRAGGFLAATLASNGGPEECHGVGSAQVNYAAA